MSLRLRLHDYLQGRLRGPDVPLLRHLLKARPGERILDLGGGTGLVAAQVAGDAEVVVVEPDEGKVAYGSARRPSLQFVKAGAERLPFPVAHFDRALMLLSFHHMPDQEGALAEVRRVLKPGATLVVQELDPTTRTGHFVHFFEQRLLHQDCHFHTRSDLPAMLAKAGFRTGAPERAARGYVLVATRP